MAPSLESVPSTQRTRAVEQREDETRRRRTGARGDSRQGVYLARFQNLDVLYLVPFHFRRRYLSEGRQLFEINVGDSPFRLFGYAAYILDDPRLFSNEGGECVSDSILSL